MRIVTKSDSFFPGGSTDDQSIYSHGGHEYEDKAAYPFGSPRILKSEAAEQMCRSPQFPASIMWKRWR